MAFERNTEDSPLVRLTNGLLLEMMRQEDELLRLPSDGRATVRRADTPWRLAMTIPHRVVADVMARLFTMASFPFAPEGRAMGRIQLRVGPEQSALFQIHSRPAARGLYVLVHRLTPDLTARTVLPPASDAWTRELQQITTMSLGPERSRALLALAAEARRAGDAQTELSAWCELLAETDDPHRALELADELSRACDRTEGSLQYRVESLLQQANALLGLPPAGRGEDLRARLDVALDVTASLSRMDPVRVDIQLAIADLLERAGEPTRSRALREGCVADLRALVLDDDEMLVALQRQP